MNDLRVTADEIRKHYTSRAASPRRKRVWTVGCDRALDVLFNAALEPERIVTDPVSLCAPANVTPPTVDEISAVAVRRDLWPIMLRRRGFGRKSMVYMLMAVDMARLARGLKRMEVAP